MKTYINRHTIINRNVIIFLIQILFLIVLSFLNIFIFKISNINIFSLILFVFCIISFLSNGYEKSDIRNSKEDIYLIFVSIIIFYIIKYIFGILTGFQKSGYSFKFLSIIKNIFPYLILFIIREIYRYMYFSVSKKNKFAVFFGLIFFILIDVNLNMEQYNVFNNTGLIEMICLVVFPSVSKNILLSYMASKNRIVNCIIYFSLIELSTFYLPIYPDFGIYINTVLELIFPFLLLYILNNRDNFNEKRKISLYRNKKYNKFLTFIILLLLSLIIILTSGKFKYYALAIGSNSMSPYIKKGDVVLINKIDNKNIDKSLKKGDIIAFKNKNLIIVHRLIKIKNVNGVKYYITKGDNNVVEDNWALTSKDIIGIIKFRIKWVGLPTVTLNEKINEGSNNE